MGLAASGFGFVDLYFALQPSLRCLPAMNDIDPEAFDIRIESPPTESSE